MSSYNTGQTNGSHVTNGGRDDGETTALLKKPQGHAITDRLGKHLTAKLDRSWADLILLLCYVVTGLLDSSAVFIYGCFVSMQTGNTIYLGLGLIEPDASDRWIKSGISIVAFCFGSFCFSRLHQTFEPTKRWVLMASYTLQMLLIAGAALITTFGPEISKESPVTAWVAVPLVMIAIQSAGQTVTSRALQYNGTTSVVLTSSYTDLFSDPKLFTSSLRDNPERNRRLVAPFLLLAGALMGGLFEHDNVGLAGALWIATSIKALIVIIWFFWKADPKPEE
ncbi:hypothetical protein AMS68_005741 [Peltaster fructicola]|uniref:DUF1275 domain protein n=1 Tax=Peltaster fructicola TaxID=286661 RepID=A0A6H0XZR0_9PEZI|nr:hypothetical protein AMS68_005741 [Peltaster fructicola]